MKKDKLNKLMEHIETHITRTLNTGMPHWVCGGCGNHTQVEDEVSCWLCGNDKIFVENLNDLPILPWMKTELFGILGYTDKQEPKNETD